MLKLILKLICNCNAIGIRANNADRRQVRPVKVEREQLSFCSRKPGKVGSQVVFPHLQVFILGVNKQLFFHLDPHLKAERDETGERGFPHLGFLGAVTLNQDGSDLGTHLVDG